MAKWVENINELNKIANNTVTDIYISVADLQSAYDEQGADGVKTLLMQRGLNTFADNYSTSTNIGANLVTTASSILVMDETATGLTTLYMSAEEIDGVPFIKFSAMPETDNTNSGSATTLMNYKDFFAMVLTATGLGWEAMNEYPEYWTNALNRYKTLGGSEQIAVDIRETDSGIKVYANSKDIANATKVMAEQGSYEQKIITTGDMPTVSTNDLTLASGEKSTSPMVQTYIRGLAMARNIYPDYISRFVIDDMPLGENLVRSRFDDKDGFYMAQFDAGYLRTKYTADMIIYTYAWSHSEPPVGDYNATSGDFTITSGTITETLIMKVDGGNWEIRDIVQKNIGDAIKIANSNIHDFFEIERIEQGSADYSHSNYYGRPFTTTQIINGNPATPPNAGTASPIISAQEAESETTGSIEQIIKDMYTDWPEKGYTKPSINPSGVGTLNNEEYWPIGTTTADPNNNSSANSQGTPTQSDMTEEGGKPLDVGNAQSNSSVTTPSAEASTNAFNPYYPPSPNIGDKHPVDAYTGGLMFNAHVLTKSKLDEIGALFWQADFLTQIINYFAGDPLDTVIGCLEFYCDVPSAGSSHVYWGPIRSAGVAPNVGKRYFGMPCGTVNIPNYYNDARDYSPFAKAEIYLPFIGWQAINVEDIMGASVEVHYAIDAFTGACLASIYSTKDGSTKELYSFTGVCGASLPLTGANHNELIASIINTTVGVAKGSSLGVAGGVGSAITGAINIASNIAPTINRSGAFNGNCGAMGHKKPYIVITRKVAYDAGNYNKFYGYPANITRRLDTISGYARIKEIHLDNIVCTDDEKSELDRLLKAGVIF